MTDVPQGRDYLWTLPVTDANGSRVTSGVVVTYDVRNPLGTIVQSTTNAHWGNGNWGFLITANNLTVPGTYTVIPPAQVILGPQELQYRYDTFTVGLGEAGVRTLRDILVDLSIALSDGVECATTTLGNTTSFTDTRWALGQANELAGAQVYFLNRTSPLNADPNPVTVSASTNAGVITFTPPQTANVALATPYLIGGKKYPHATKLAALRQVLEDLGPLEATGDRYTLTSVINQYEYDVPQPFLNLSAVYFQPTTTTIPTQWRKLAKGIFWNYRRDRRKLELTPAAPITLVRYRLEGTIEARLPDKLTDYVPVRAATVVRLAEVFLRARSGDGLDKQEAAFLYQDLVRRGRVTARAGVVG